MKPPMTAPVAAGWSPRSWRSKPALQMPTYEDQGALESAETELAKYPPLIFAGEARQLKKELARVCEGEGFLFQGGDCAESFCDFSANGVRDLFRVFLQSSLIMSFAGGKHVTKVARLAGQFGKPRSSDTETRNGVTLPSYRGDIINDVAFSAEARKPDPQRMVRGYFQSASTLNLLRAFASGGYADLNRAHNWLLDFVEGTPAASEYAEMIDQLSKCMTFMEACEINGATSSQIRSTSFYTSHESLLLNYEQALLRQDSLTGIQYATSAHLLWIGDRTRQPGGAHVEFLRGIDNPIGIKCGPSLDPAELKDLVRLLNPENEPGRLTLIVRVGAGKVKDLLPAFIKTVRDGGYKVVWCCDAVHANTFTSESGFKTRAFNDVVQETNEFFQVCREEGAYPGGVHVEMTGLNVTECIGGQDRLTDNQLAQNYHTLCDPRLNASQATEYAFEVAKLLRGSS